MTIRASEIAALASAIADIRRFATPADSGLSAFFRAHRELGARDRPFIADGVFAMLRRMRSLEALAETSDPRRLALAVVVRDMGRSLRDLSARAQRLRRRSGCARSSRTASRAPARGRARLAGLAVDRLGAYGDDTRAALARAWLAPATLDLRVNVVKSTRDAALAALAVDGYEARPTPYSPVGIRLAGHPSLVKHPWLADGRMEVQDEGSQLIGYAVAPRRSDMVVDFCAGAGGKTLLLGALMRSQGRLYAFDVSEARLLKLTPRLARSGLSNVHPQVLGSERDAKVKRLAGKIDRVLVDAPCTGFGTLRRNPDLKWRQPEGAVAELAARQSSILAAAATLVKPGGRLVYATCSVLPDENEDVVGAFLTQNPAFTMGNVAAELARAGIDLDTGPTLKLMPHLHGCDGFFAAILERSR